MINFIRKLAAILGLCLGISVGAYAGEVGTPDEAKAMAIRAADLLRSAGPEKAFPVFDKDAEFHDRDLYVMVYDVAGKNVSHGANPALIGKNLIDLKDSDGKFMIHDFVAIKDANWVDYKWPNPTTKKIEPKTTYVVRVNDYLVGVGAYKP
jgi:cytochrome c